MIMMLMVMLLLLLMMMMMLMMIMMTDPSKNYVGNIAPDDHNGDDYDDD